MTGRGRGPQHPTHPTKEKEPLGDCSTVCCDFWYPGAGAGDGGEAEEEEEEEEDEEERAEGENGKKALDRLPALVLWDGTTKALAASLLPGKSVVRNRYAVDYAVTVIDHDWGLAGETVILKGDGEPALVAFRKEVAGARRGRTILETSPPGDHQANGAAEQAVRTARAHYRTHLAALAAKLNLEDMPADTPILPWAIRHGAWCYCRFAVGADGRTGWERARGKPYKAVLAQLGETVLFLRPLRQRRTKQKGRFQKGIFLGRVDRTDEVMVAQGNKLVRTTKFLRLPEKEQWSAASVDALRGLLPWKPEGPSEDEAAPPLPPGPLTSADAGPAGPDEEPETRRKYLTQQLLSKYGRTPGCPGCHARGGVRRNHTEACRERVTRAWEEDALKRVAELEAQLAEPGEDDARGDDELQTRPQTPRAPSADFLERRRRMDAGEAGPPAEPPQPEREEEEEEEELENTELETAETSTGQTQAARKRQRRPEEQAFRDRRSDWLADDGDGIGAEENPHAGTSSSSTSLPGASAQAAPEERGEKRPAAPESWLQAGETRKQKVSALLAFAAVSGQPTCSDADESTVLEEHAHYALLKPVYDASSGVELDPSLVKAARKEELDEVEKHRVYRKVLRQMARDRGKRVIGVKWVDLNKGDDARPAYRSRLVAKELRAFSPLAPQEELYAATPPTAAQNLLLRMLCTRLSRRGKRFKLCFLDVRRAFFYANATEEVFVELPPEDKEPGKDLVGLLEKSMYGTRTASRNWQQQLGRDLQALGFRLALSSPCLYYHAE